MFYRWTKYSRISILFKTPSTGYCQKFLKSSEQNFYFL